MAVMAPMGTGAPSGHIPLLESPKKTPKKTMLRCFIYKKVATGCALKLFNRIPMYLMDPTIRLLVPVGFTNSLPFRRPLRVFLLRENDSNITQVGEKGKKIWRLKH